ncbi:MULTISPECIES: helix-turn-helix transcriptional regulator [Mycobacteroides]|uniref:helix-turn-helix transcriptional regulator n=1 Tax=Mycobacteroides TaxID=670516 RepID=UPI0008A8AEA8|nr:MULTISPECIES: helix-turn-helix domain-containing protein [Mycobacteroides]AYM44492.1 transcriptional regulator [[Mycobacterium] chelonae subsp. gwanakae]OHU16926.1 transcriptional regulator [Mycobacteroides chelonae]TDZ91636.1 Helix-turn-helix domain protein [Mycobacteroides salmoniphilum]
MPGEETSGRRRDVLRVLKAGPGPMSIVEIAKILDVHPNTVRFHLDTLVSDETVEHVEPGRKGPGRPPLMFRAIPQMDRGGPRRYQLLAEILTVTLASSRRPSVKAQAAGRMWGLQFKMAVPSGKKAGINESIGQLVEVLSEFGFAPERRKSGVENQIGLRHCPFLELAEARREIICPIHLGLMQGILEGQGASVTVGRLDAFVEPDLCLAHLVQQRVPG